MAIDDGLLYAADLSGFLYCLNVDTGELYWTYDSFAAVWGSPFVADGKVYMSDEDGDKLKRQVQCDWIDSLVERSK